MTTLKERLARIAKEQNELDSKRDLFRWTIEHLEKFPECIEPELVYLSNFVKTNATLYFSPSTVEEVKKILEAFPATKGWHAFDQNYGWLHGALWEGSEAPAGMQLDIVELKLSCTCDKPETTLAWYCELGTMRLRINANLVDGSRSASGIKAPFMRQKYVRRHGQDLKDGRDVRTPAGWKWAATNAASDGNQGGAGYLYYAFRMQEDVEQLFKVMEGNLDGE